MKELITKHFNNNSRNIKHQSAPTVQQKNTLETVEVVSYFLYPSNSYMVIEMGEGCREGTDYVITFPDFIGELSDDLEGFYRTVYNDENGVER